eukprot:TRINITY_DN2776_c0_g1_i12.p1 TRINITY_DN2776_c0_g1~~TRINITY_DN2776_c0_g1_i12.p1  ORF type:complete len:199 (+),score=66.98 TRINITY_DN2776_c0_g1_i12:140-736(+)
MEIVDYARLSQEVFDEINLARHVPNSFVSSLISKYEFFNENIYTPPGEFPTETYEGEKAVNEAIDFLKSQEPLPVIVSHPGLQRVALEYAEDLVESGDFSTPHIDTQDTTPAQRISRVMRWAKMAGECIEVGNKTATDIVLSLIVDDGNEERSNRKVLFDKEARLGGVVCIPHSVFGVITVVDIVGGEYENSGHTQQF